MERYAARFSIVSGIAFAPEWPARNQGPADSSDAKNPLPDAHNACAVALSSANLSAGLGSAGVALVAEAAAIPAQENS